MKVINKLVRLKQGLSLDYKLLKHRHKSENPNESNIALNLLYIFKK